MYKFYSKNENKDWVEENPNMYIKNVLVDLLYEEDSVEIYYPASNIAFKVEKV